MITLFEENETEFTSLGLGVLKDAFSCAVTEKLNDTFELTMNYPVNGKLFKELKINRIIYCKPNPYASEQPFRIYSITKPIKGSVTVDAVHISYDMNGIPVKAISGSNLTDTLDQVSKNSMIANKFMFTTDIMSGKTFKTTAPYNMRAIFMGGDESIVEQYDGELEFDKFTVKLLEKRGKNRGAKVVYANNMTDLNHVSSTDNLYNGVFPYYHSEKTSTETDSEEAFKKAYIVGSKPFQDGWLSFTKDGEPYHPLDESPVQIATEGKYKDKVYSWSNIYQKYFEKIYNQQIIIVEGVLEPTWISIDWSNFPKIVCKANKKGYFKKSTDDDWGEIRGVGDVIFEGSIINSGIMDNMILCYSEVIPSTTDSTNKEVTEIVDVQLDDPIIWLETNEAKAMLHDKVLAVDLSSEFDEEPSKERLKSKAEEFINENKIGRIKHTTTVSFIDLTSTTEDKKYINFEGIQLGDTVKVLYRDLDVDVDLRVLETAYDPISKRYTSVNLGEKPEKLSTSTIQNGDNVSSLTNDAGYADVTTVNKLIADTVTAEYIEAVNAKMSKAQIEQLSVERIDCKGIMEASQFTLDKLVSKLLVADNAEIAETLKAGNIKVAGDVDITKGSIRISDEATTTFSVDRDGNVNANSVNITGGTFNINNGTFEVTSDGVMTANAADISGTIRAKDGEISGFNIKENSISKGYLGDYNSVYLSTGSNESISIGGSDTINGWAITAGNNFGVTNTGNLFARNAKISGEISATTGRIANFTIKNDKIYTYAHDTYYSTEDGIYIGQNGISLGTGFKVSNTGAIEAMSVDLTGTDGSKVKIQNGKITADNADISGKISTSEGKIANFNISEDKLYTTGYDTFEKSYGNGIYLGSDGISIAQGFSVTSNGNTTIAKDLKVGKQYNYITGETTYGLTVDSNGNVEMKGKVTASEGKIANFNIGTDKLYTDGYTTFKADVTNGIYLGTDGISLGKNFSVSKDGKLEASDVKISGGELNINNNFKVNTSGELTASSATITGGSLNINNGVFKVDPDGKVTASSVKITGGELSITDAYSVGTDGKLKATNAEITGKITATSGSIGGLKIDNDKLSYGTDKLVIYAHDAGTDPRDTTYNISAKAAKFDKVVVSQRSGSYGSWNWAEFKSDGFRMYWSDSDNDAQQYGCIPAEEYSNIPVIVNATGLGSSSIRNPMMFIYNVDISSNGVWTVDYTNDSRVTAVLTAIVNEHYNSTASTNNHQIEINGKQLKVHNRAARALRFSVLVFCA